MMVIQLDNEDDNLRDTILFKGGGVLPTEENQGSLKSTQNNLTSLLDDESSLID